MCKVSLTSSHLVYRLPSNTGPQLLQYIDQFPETDSLQISNTKTTHCVQQEHTEHCGNSCINNYVLYMILPLLTLSVNMREMHFLIRVITVSFSVPIRHLTVHRLGSLVCVNVRASSESMLTVLSLECMH